MPYRVQIDDEIYKDAAGSGGGGSLAIGDTVSGSTADRMLYMDGSNELANSAWSAEEVNLFGLLDISYLNRPGVTNVRISSLDATALGGGQSIGIAMKTSLSSAFAISNIDTFAAYFVVNKDSSDVASTTFGVTTFSISDQSSNVLFDTSTSGVRLGGANARVTTILDEDNMASDSATALATQQSIKAYVDTEIAGIPSGTPGGSTTYVQFNNAGVFDGVSNFVWNDTNKSLIITGQTSKATDYLRLENSSAVHVGGFDFLGRVVSDMGTSPTNFFGGDDSGNASITGTANTGIGDGALKGLTTGSQNVAIGLDSLRNTTTGNFNFALGNQALKTVTTQSHNVAIGTEAAKITTGASTISIGTLAGYQAGNYCVYVGDTAGRGSTAANNVGIGLQALRNNAGGSTVGVGMYAGYSSGARGVYLGYAAGENETGADKLYIANSNTATPLIYGDFSTADVVINGDLDVTGAITDSGVAVPTISSTSTLTNKSIDADTNTITNIEVADLKGSAVVTESEGIASNDNDTTLPTSAAVKDYVDANAGSWSATRGAGTAVVDDGTETTLLSSVVDLPAMAAGVAVEFIAVIEYINNSGANRNPTWRFKIGSSTVITLNQGNASASATSRFATITGVIYAIGTNSVRLSAFGLWQATNGGFATISMSGSGTAAEAIQTAGVDFNITVQHPSATTLQSAQLLSLTLKQVDP